MGTENGRISRQDLTGEWYNTFENYFKYSFNRKVLKFISVTTP